MPIIKHIAFDEPGKAKVMYLAEGELPELTAGQVTIDVYAAGVNGPDIKQRMGAYPPPAGASPIMGLEVAGVISAVASDVTQWQVGDKVCALVPGGGYAEKVNTFAEHCLPIPKGLSFTQAAALPETCFTVYGNMFMRAGLKSGETVLVHGGSGGIGSTAIQMAVQMGARVIATSGSDEKCEYCLSLGASHAINYQRGFVDEVMTLTGNQGVNVVVDVAGGEFINDNLKVLAMDGRMVSIAMARGMQATVDIFRLMAKRIMWTGSTLRPQSVESKAAIANGLSTHIWPKIESGDFYLPIDSVFDFSDVILAHERMESGKHKGKIVLQLRE